MLVRLPSDRLRAAYFLGTDAFGGAVPQAGGLVLLSGRSWGLRFPAARNFKLIGARLVSFNRGHEMLRST